MSTTRKNIATTAEQTGDLLSALELLAEKAGASVESPAALSALEAAMRANPGETGERWSDWLLEAGRSLGLPVARVRVPLSELMATVGPTSPAVGRTNAGMLIVASDRRGARVRIESLSPAVPRRWLRTRALAAQLGGGDGGPPSWVVVEPLAAGAAEGAGLSPERRMWRLLRLEMRDIRVLVAYALGIGVLSLAVPIAVQWLVNTVAFGAVLQPILVLALLVLAGLAFAAVLQALQEYVVEIIQRRIFVRVGVDLAYRLPRVQVEAFDAAHGPELVNRFFDVLTVQKSAAVLLLDGVAVTLTAGVGLVVLAFYHPIFIAFDLLLIAGLLLGVFWLLGRGGSATSIKESKAKYRVAAWLEEIARHPVSFKSEAGATFASRRADALLRDYLGARRKHFRVVLRQLGGALGLQAVASAILLGIGGWLVIQRELTLGQLVAAELIVAKVVADFAKTGKYLQSYYDLVAAVEKLGQLLDLPLERSRGEGESVSPRPAAVALRGVSFGFEDNRVLEGVDLTLRPGEHVVLLGPNGSGKSVLCDLLFGLRDPQAGAVTLDGADLRDLSLRALRRQVALVRGVEIFEGTVADNVLMGRTDLQLADVRNALAQVDLLEEVERLPAGLETVLATGGSPLSPGQAKRLVLARAIVGRPRLLLIDEALDGVDQESREGILESLFAPGTPWTLIKVTQKPSTIRRGDRCFELRDGTLREIDSSSEPPTGLAPLTPEVAT